MKISIIASWLGAVLISGSILAESPSISIDKAIDLARQQLQVRGLDKTIFIQSASLESAAALTDTRVWRVLWSDPVTIAGGKTEIGVEVNQKGEVVRLVRRIADAGKR